MQEINITWKADHRVSLEGQAKVGRFTLVQGMGDRVGTNQAEGGPGRATGPGGIAELTGQRRQGTNGARHQGAEPARARGHEPRASKRAAGRRARTRPPTEGPSRTPVGQEDQTAPEKNMICVYFLYSVHYINKIYINYK